MPRTHETCEYLLCLKKSIEMLSDTLCDFMVSEFASLGIFCYHPHSALVLGLLRKQKSKPTLSPQKCPRTSSPEAGLSTVRVVASIATTRPCVAPALPKPQVIGR